MKLTAGLNHLLLDWTTVKPFIKINLLVHLYQIYPLFI